MLITRYNKFRTIQPEDRCIDISWYQEVIGSLIYVIVYMRLDIAFALGRLS
jgi:hypothetical protein